MTQNSRSDRRGKWRGSVLHLVIAMTSVFAYGCSTDKGAAQASAKTYGMCDSDAQCDGGTCIELAPNGFRACKLAVDPPYACSDGGNDTCCASKACPTGQTCVPIPVAPCAEVAGNNLCAQDQCASNDDCRSDEVCAPAGVLWRQIAQCMLAKCKRDSDCTEEPGGRCVPFTPACCNTGGYYGLYCSYPSGCESGCDGGRCIVDGSRLRCSSAVITCTADGGM